MTTGMIRRYATVAGVSLAFSLLAAGASFAADNYAPVPYYDYAPMPYPPSYSGYSGTGYYMDGDGYIVAMPAFRPGCGAGEPHCF